VQPTAEDYWRAIILYGKNSSTFKMGLGECLIKFASKNEDKVSLDEVTAEFYEIYRQRCQNGKPQLKLQGRKTYVERELQEIQFAGKDVSKSLEVIKRKCLLDMVLKRFNNLNRHQITQPFYTVSEDEQFLNLNQNLLGLFEGEKNQSLLQEIRSRWDLLEHAFETINNIGLIDSDAELEYLLHREKRNNLTKVIPALEGYQQGRCFYCGELLYDIEVDHVIPYSVLQHNKPWNLVLSHCDCNQNKSDSIPPEYYIRHLIIRNEYLIRSEHPLRDTLIKDTGKTLLDREAFVNHQYVYAKDKIRRFWNGDSKYIIKEDEFYRKMVRFFGADIQQSYP
jgi:5-methylcytosine-specific restriction endonuclease McrA